MALLEIEYIVIDRFSLGGVADLFAIETAKSNLTHSSWSIVVLLFFKELDAVAPRETMNRVKDSVVRQDEETDWVIGCWLLLLRQSIT